MFHIGRRLILPRQETLPLQSSTAALIPGAAGRTINRLKALVDLLAHPPAAPVSLAQTAMGVAVHSGVAAAIRPVVSQAPTRPEVSPVAIRLGVSRVVVTEAAEAADKSQDKLP